MVSLKSKSKTSSPAHKASIDIMTLDTLQQFEDRLKSKKLRLEKELQSTTADVLPNEISAAIYQLIENAIARSPEGGNVNVTLVDNENCWELEVANSSKADFERWGAAQNSPLPDCSSSASLQAVIDAAESHGGELKSLNCPLGGTANILKIPRQNHDV